MGEETLQANSCAKEVLCRPTFVDFHKQNKRKRLAKAQMPEMRYPRGQELQDKANHASQEPQETSASTNRPSKSRAEEETLNSETLNLIIAYPWYANKERPTQAHGARRRRHP